MDNLDYYDEVLMLRKKVRAYEDTNSQASDALVVKSLKKYYDICSKPDKVDCSDDLIEPDKALLQAIDRVLADYMSQDEYDRWKNENNL